MKANHIVSLVLAAGLAFAGYKVFRTGAGSGGICLIPSSFLAPRASVQKIANETGKSQPAPDWQLKDVEGKPVKLSDFKGKVVVLNFWATWCAPCRMEIPALIALQKQYAAKGLVVVGISVDEGSGEAVKSFMTKTGINYPVVLGGRETAGAYGNVQVIPTTFYIDREGNIAGKREGAAELPAFETQIKPLLGPPAL